jgi:hypothetical protein
MVHEAAHIFHNCKRRTIGLREPRTKEWLLDVVYRQRETFAYSCEAYACIVARAKIPAARRELAADYGSERRISDERVDPSAVASIVAEGLGRTFRPRSTCGPHTGYPMHPCGTVAGVQDCEQLGHPSSLVTGSAESIQVSKPAVCLPP